MRALSLLLLLVVHLQALESIFTSEEKQWMQENPVVHYVGDPSWLPYEGYNEHGRYIGLVPDLLALASGNTPLTFEHVDTLTWKESLEKVNNGQVMMISQSHYSNRNTDLNFTRVYLRSPVVIVMQQGERYVSSLHQIRDKKIGLLDNQTSTPALKRLYPNINFHLYKNRSRYTLSQVLLGRYTKIHCKALHCFRYGPIKGN